MARPRSDIQDRILVAAQARFLAEGVEAASLRAIAKDAETSIGMVYYYYTTKDDLFLAIVEEVYQKFLEDIEAILAERKSLRERLAALYGRVGAMTENEMQVVQLIVRETLSSHERRERIMRRFLRGHLPLLMRAILDASAAGEIDPKIHPMVAMACTLGFAGAATMLGRVAKASPNSDCGDCPAPEFLRDVIRNFAERIPSGDELAEQLSSMFAEALAPRRDGSE